MKKFIITGGACVGKTTMINELKRRGYPVVGETSRVIIDSEQVHEKMNPTYKGVFPWVDNFKFQEMVIKLQIAMEANLSDTSGKCAFLDRSLVDGIAYSKIWDNPVVDGLTDLIKNSNYTKVFFLERLDFYEQDEERKESEEVNLKVHEELYNVYTELGFDIVEVPALPIDERVDFIIKHINVEDESTIVIEVEHCMHCPMRGMGGTDGPDTCDILHDMGKDGWKPINDPESAQIPKSYEMTSDIPTKCPLILNDTTIVYRLKHE